MYLLLCIYIMIDVDAFQVIADPTRRQIVQVLRQGEASVSDVVARLDIQQSGVSRHLRILGEAGFVQVRPDGQRRMYSLRSEPFQEIDAWLDEFRRLWDARLDRFGKAAEDRSKTTSTAQTEGKE